MKLYAKSQGYRVELFSELVPRPKGRGYETNDIFIWDPKDPNGRFEEGYDYALAWRILHELGHAQTLAAAEAKYGPCKRGGKLGDGMSLDNAKQALWWEILAVTRQHEILEDLGWGQPRETMVKEINITLFDGLARIITGEFINPDALGFVPNTFLPQWREVVGLLEHFASESELRS